MNDNCFRLFFERTKLRICPTCYKNFKGNIRYGRSKNADLVASSSFPAMFFAACVCFSYMNPSNCEMFIQDQSMVYFPLTSYQSSPHSLC